MQTTTLIQASAEVRTVTQFKRFDVYKRVDKSYSGEAHLKFGIVTDVMHNGTEGAIAALEFDDTAYDPKPTTKVIATGSDFAIYPATPEEIRVHFDAVVAAVARKVREAAEALEKARDMLGRVEAIQNDVISGIALTNPVTVRGVIASDLDASD